MKAFFIFVFAISMFTSVAQKSSYRKILLFAPNEMDAVMKEQNGIFQKADAGCTERDIVVETYPYLYIGVDWIEEHKHAVYVQPKLNDDSQETDFFRFKIRRN